ASIFNSLAGIAVDVISLFMALLSSRGISTPSLQAQGEQRRFFCFNNDRDIPSDLLPPWLLRDPPLHHTGQGAEACQRAPVRSPFVERRPFRLHPLALSPPRRTDQTSYPTDFRMIWPIRRGGAMKAKKPPDLGVQE
ncbi:MAG: hypothetical protein ACLP4V_12960, partial [Methylocella sp.]